MAYSLKEQFPDTYHPREKDLDNNRLQNVPREPPVKTNVHRINPIPTTMPILPNAPTYFPPIVHPPNVPSAFLPMANMSLPYLPPGVSIPKNYTRPAPLLKPQRPSQNPVRQTLPPTSSAQQQLPHPSYAQIANPWYYQNSLPQPTTAYPYAQQWQLHPQSINQASQQRHYWNTIQRPVSYPD